MVFSDQGVPPHTRGHSWKGKCKRKDEMILEKYGKRGRRAPRKNTGEVQSQMRMNQNSLEGGEGPTEKERESPGRCRGGRKKRGPSSLDKKGKIPRRERGGLADTAKISIHQGSFYLKT